MPTLTARLREPPDRRARHGDVPAVELREDPAGRRRGARDRAVPRPGHERGVRGLRGARPPARAALGGRRRRLGRGVRGLRGLRAPNARAIAEMAIENYLEMRDEVRDAKFRAARGPVVRARAAVPGALRSALLDGDVPPGNPVRGGAAARRRPGADPARAHRGAPPRSRTWISRARRGSSRTICRRHARPNGSRRSERPAHALDLLPEPRSHSMSTIDLRSGAESTATLSIAGDHIVAAHFRYALPRPRMALYYRHVQPLARSGPQQDKGGLK